LSISPEIINELAGEVIDNIVQQVQQNPEKLKGAIVLLSKISKYASEYFSRKAKRVFREIWDSRQFGFSTEPEYAKDFLNDVELPDNRWKKLYDCLSDETKYLLIVGLRISCLINGGLHAEAETLKHTITEENGYRAKTISNIITTNDIEVFLIKLDKFNKKEISKEFNKFIRNYDKFSYLVSPRKLDENIEISNRIRTMSIDSKIIIINMCGQMDECMKLVCIVEKLKNNTFQFDLQTDIGDSGFKKYIKIIMKMKK